MAKPFEEYPYLQFTGEAQGQLDVVRAQLGLRQGEIVGVVIGLGHQALELLMTASAYTEADPVLVIEVREGSDEDSPVIASGKFIPLSQLVREYKADYSDVQKQHGKSGPDDSDGLDLLP